MRFMLDENVPAGVAAMLIERGHEAEYIRDYVPPGAADPVVATVAQELEAVLISFDGDFQRIAPRIPHGQRARFRRLSRVWLRCREPRAADRLSIALSFIETEMRMVESGELDRFAICVGDSFLRTDR
jgi:predicted nuclease of predicted toxin-antitoxin system